MEYNEMAAKRRKKLKSYALMRLLRLFAAAFFPHSVAYAAASSVTAENAKNTKKGKRRPGLTDQTPLAFCPARADLWTLDSRL